MDITPNIFAYFVLIVWPIVVFNLVSKKPVEQAILIAIVLSSLLLPATLNFDLPLLPALDREAITTVALVIALYLSGNKLRILLPGMVTKLVIAFFVVIIITNLVNDASYSVSTRQVPGLTFYDGISALIGNILSLLPFFLGRYFLTNVNYNENIFKFIALVATIYALPMLFEVVMSPQLHRWIYGYYPSDFLQQIRSGGYRPMVFLGHGLGLAFWFSTCLIAGFALKKNKIAYTRGPKLMIAITLLTTLVLCKTFSAVLYYLVGILTISKLAPTKQIKVSLILAFIVMLYPIAKTADILPEKEIISNIQQYSPERAESLEFRFFNEGILLNHALEHPYFGWGGWGRNRVYDIHDGKDNSVTDGAWVIVIGEYGSIGFIIFYAILIAPLFYALKSVKYIEDPKEKAYFAALAIILAICIIDSVPNSGMGPMHLLLAGALLGQAETLKKNMQIKLKAKYMAK